MIIPESILYKITLDMGNNYGESLIYGPKVIIDKAKKINELTTLFSIIGNISSKSEYDLVVLLTPPSVAYVVDRFLRLLGDIKKQVIILPRVEDEITFLIDDIKKMHESSEKITSSFLSAIEKQKTIKIIWNKDSEHPSQIEITFSPSDYHPQKNYLFRIEDGLFHGAPFYTPLGEVRVNLEEIIKAGGHIRGTINLLGEPIIGLKLHSEEWIKYGYSDLEATLQIETLKNSLHPHIIEISNEDLFWARILKNSYIAEFHIGLNQTTRKKIREPISPIITRTNLLIHFWIINPKEKTFYQLLAKNAEIWVENEKIWETKKYNA